MLQNTFGILKEGFDRHFCHIMSSSSSRSSSPAELSIAKKNKAKAKTKTSSSSKGVPQNDPSWPFAVPAGYNLCGANPDDEVDENFDWDALKSNPNLELWLIRVPHNVRRLEWADVGRHVNSH